MTIDSVGGATEQTKKASVLQEAVEKAYADLENELTESGDKVAIWVSATDALKACTIARDHQDLQFDYLSCLSGMDYPDGLQVVYHLYSTVKKHWLVIKARVSKDEPVIDSVVPVWMGANWHEREAADMFGIVFKGHPNPKVLLLREDFTDHPLLKSYKLPDYPPQTRPSKES